MRFNGIRCDQCDKVKGEANKWLVVIARGQFVAIGPLDRCDQYFSEKEHDARFDACGMDCALALQSQLLAKHQKGTP